MSMGTSSSMAAGTTSGLLMIWRHPRPRPRAMAGRCIGRTDLGADPRKARRQARRIARWAQRHRWPGRTIWTSPLARAAIVGRLLKRRGWQHRIDPRLAEVDFGRWDGLRWSDVPVAEIDRWSRDLQGWRPGGGESVAMLAQRVRAFCLDQCQARVLVVGHGGWIRVARALAAGERLDAGNWSRHQLAHGRLLELDPAVIADAGQAPPMSRADSGPGADPGANPGANPAAALPDA